MKMSAAMLFAALVLSPSFSPGASAQTPVVKTEHFEERITEQEVADVQAELIRRGYLKAEASGELNLRTREAVRAYQADNGLTVTGRVDRRTYNHLRLISPSKPAVRTQTSKTEAVVPTTRRAAGEAQQGQTQPGQTQPGQTQPGQTQPGQTQPGTMSKIGGGVQDTTAGVGRLAGDVARKAGSGTRAGLEKSWDAGAAAASKSRDAAREVGKATGRGVKGGGRMTVNVFRRRDADIHDDVYDMLDVNPATRGWRFEVKEGMVTLTVPRGHNADIGAVVSELRKIVGVRSVVVLVL